MPVNPRKSDPHLTAVGGEVGVSLLGLCHQWRRLLAEVPPRALREVDRPSRNPEKLANVGGNQSQNRVGQMSGDALTIKRKHD